jgi:hypothetical protein
VQRLQFYIAIAVALNGEWLDIEQQKGRHFHAGLQVQIASD